LAPRGRHDPKRKMGQLCCACGASTNWARYCCEFTRLSGYVLLHPRKRRTRAPVLTGGAAAAATIIAEGARRGTRYLQAAEPRRRGGCPPCSSTMCWSSSMRLGTVRVSFKRWAPRGVMLDIDLIDRPPAGSPFSWGVTSGGPPGGRSLSKTGTPVDSAKDFCR